jgi:hypothetical protein
MHHVPRLSAFLADKRPQHETKRWGAGLRHTGMLPVALHLPQSSPMTERCGARSPKHTYHQSDSFQ